MTLPSQTIIISLRKKGLTLAAIGQEFGVTRQRVWAKATGYKRRYEKTPYSLMYKRHQFHYAGASPRKPCDFCEAERQAEKKESLSTAYSGL